jgi:hypothetical protein
MCMLSFEPFSAKRIAVLHFLSSHWSVEKLNPVHVLYSTFFLVTLSFIVTQFNEIDLNEIMYDTKTAEVM